MHKLMSEKKIKRSFINYAIVIIFFIIMQILVSTGHLSNSLSGQLVPIVSYMMMAVSLNLVVGISGELSLGHAGFMSVGAFTGVILAAVTPGSGIVRLLLAVIAGAIMAGIFGVLIGIPVLRLKGDYLAIVTLAFGEIIKNILNCLYIGADSHGLHIATDMSRLTLEPGGVTILSGPMGALGINKCSTFAFGIVMLLLVLIVIQNMCDSRTGRAIMAIRDNRIAAEACGVSATRYKLLAFTVSASIAGAAGAYYALNFSTIVPKKFDFNTSILVLVFVVLGGIGNMTGSLIVAGLLTVLPELLRSFRDYRMLVYAIVLILVMIVSNNPTLRTFVRSLFHRRKTDEAVPEVHADPGADQEGGNGHE